LRKDVVGPQQYTTKRIDSFGRMYFRPTVKFVNNVKVNNFVVVIKEFNSKIHN